MSHNRLDLRERLLTGGISATVGKLVRTALVFLMITLIVRFLSPGEAGDFFLVQSVVLFAATAGTLGVEKAALNYIPRLDQRDKEGLRNALSALVALAALGIGLSVIVFLYLQNILGGLFQTSVFQRFTFLIAAWVGLSILQRFLAEVFKAFNRVGLSVLFGGLLWGVLSSFLIVIGLLVAAFDSGFLLLGTVLQLIVAAYALNCVFSIGYLASMLSDVGLTCSVPARLMRTYLLFSAPLVLHSFISFFLTEVDIWILSALQSDVEVGIYGATVQLAKVLVFPLSIVTMVVPPLISELHEMEEKGKLEAILRGTSTVAAVPSIVAFLLYLVLGTEILSFLFGGAYGTGSLTLVILSLGYLGNAVSGPSGICLMLTGHQKALSIVTAISIILTVGTSIGLGYLYGKEGVAAGTASGLLLHNLLTLGLLSRWEGIVTYCDWTLEAPRRILG